MAVASEGRTVVLVRVAVLEIPRQSVELKAREANLSSFVLSIPLRERKARVGGKGSIFGVG